MGRSTIGERARGGTTLSIPAASTSLEGGTGGGIDKNSERNVLSNGENLIKRHLKSTLAVE
jgi:hypothetical protein